jgi:cell division protein FtsB
MKKFLLISISIILVFFLSQRIKEDWQRYQLLTEEVSGLESRKENLEREQERLEQLLEQGDQEELLEKEVRSMMGFKKEGEEVVLIVPSGTKNGLLANENTELSATLVSQDNFLSVFSQFWYNLLEKLKLSIEK